MSDAPYRYVAFISYRHGGADSRAARWVHRSLEKYRVPTHLDTARSGKRGLGRAFRDEEEVDAASDLTEAIQEALRESRFLIVVCSRRVRNSIWIDREIEYFRALGRGDSIVALLIDGDEKSSFPLEFSRPDAQGRTIDPRAADLRAKHGLSGREQRRLEKLRIFARILGVKFDDLNQRDLRRRRREARIRLAVVLLLLGAFAAGGWRLFRSEQRTRQQEQVAEKERTGRQVEERRKAALHLIDEAGRLHAAQDHAAALLFARQAWNTAAATDPGYLPQVDDLLRQILEDHPYGEFIPLPVGATARWAALSPLEDELVVAATANGEGTLLFFDLEDRVELAPRRMALDREPRQVQYLDGGKSLALLFDDGSIGWMEGQGKEVRLLPGTWSVDGGIAVASAGTLIVGVGRDSRIRTVDAAEAQAVPKTLADSPEGVFGAYAVHESGRWIGANSFGDSHIALWDLRGSSVRPRLLRADSDEQHASATFSGLTFAGDRLLAARSADAALLDWDLSEPGGAPFRRRLPQLQFAFRLMSDASGGHLAAMLDTKRTVLWRMGPIEGTPFALPGANQVPCGAGKRFATTVGTAGRVRLWHLGLLRRRARVAAAEDFVAKSLKDDGMDAGLAGMMERATRGLGATLQDLAIHPDGEPAVAIVGPGMATALGGAGSTRFLVFDGREFDSVRKTRFRAGGSMGADPASLEVPASVAFTNSGQQLIVPARGNVLVWHVDDLDAAAFRLREGTGRGDLLISVDPTPGRLTFVTAGGRHVTLWRGLGGLPEATELPGAGGHDIVSLACAPGGVRIVAGNTAGEVRIWSSALGEPAVIQAHRKPVSAVAVSADGWLLTGDAAGELAVWQLDGSAAIQSSRALLGNAVIRDIELIPDCRAAVALGRHPIVLGPEASDTASSPSHAGATVGNGSVVLVAFSEERGVKHRVIRSLENELVSSIAVTPDGDQALVGTAAGFVEWLPLESEFLLEQADSVLRRNLRREEWRRFIGPDIPYERTVPGLPEGD